MILEIIVGIYVAVALVMLGWTVGEESGFVNPEYGLAVGVSIGWPFVFAYVIGIQLIRRFSLTD